MKVDVTYGWVASSLLLFVDAIPENSLDKEIRDEFISVTQGLLEGKLKGGEYDDDNFLGVQFDAQKQKNLETIIYRVVNTVCKEYDIPLQVRAIYVKN